MGNLIYVAVVVLVVVWAIGFFGFSTGGLIHLLIVLALIALLVNIITGTK